MSAQEIETRKYIRWRSRKSLWSGWGTSPPSS